MWSAAEMSEDISLVTSEASTFVAVLLKFVTAIDQLFGVSAVTFVGDGSGFAAGVGFGATFMVYDLD